MPRATSWLMAWSSTTRTVPREPGATAGVPPTGRTRSWAGGMTARSTASWRWEGRIGRGHAPGERQLHLEGRPLAGSAVDRDASAHGLGQPPADGQAQPGAAVAAGRGGVRLGERVKDAGRGARRNADAGVDHLEP